MKARLLRFSKVLTLLLAVLFSTLLLQEYVLCSTDHNRERVKGFYLEDKDSVDVVLIGASEVYSDFAPGYAYERHGVTGYLFATQANSILTTKLQIQETLKHQSPKLILVELNSVLYANDKNQAKEANIRHLVDHLPLNADKLAFLGELSPEHPEEYLMPIIKYHDVWKNIPQDMELAGTIIANQSRGYNYLKGIKNETHVFKARQRKMNDDLVDRDAKKPLNPDSERSLRGLLQFCKDKGLKNVVFTRFPHIVVRRTFDRGERANAVGDIVREYGFDYLNFERDMKKTGVDVSEDFYNLDHLNIYGQRKFTDYVTGLLMKNYGLSPSDLGDSERREWREAADHYRAYYDYSDSLIKKGVRRELDEGVVTEPDFRKFLP